VPPCLQKASTHPIKLVIIQERFLRLTVAGAPNNYNSLMKVAAAFLLGFALAAHASAQDTAKAAPQPEVKSVTVPFTLDHNRIVIDVYVALPDGSNTHIRGWVDPGNPGFEMSRRVATLLALKIACDDNGCSAPPPGEIAIGGMNVPLAAVKQVNIPLKPVSAEAVMVPGMNAEINIPATVLRSYDLLVNYPERQFTIGRPGTISFKGAKGKILINGESGLIQTPSRIDDKNYSLAFDLGAPISYLSEELFDKLSTAHADWPHMTGAVGPANEWGLDAELKLKVMRLERAQCGPLFLTDVPVAAFAGSGFQKRVGTSASGIIGSQALRNHRVGIDYAHALVYFEIGSTFKFPDFDVIGLVLRPEDDGRFTILGAAEFEGKPAVAGVQPGDRLVAVDGIPVAGSTLGQVWAMLGGSPDKERRLTIERDGKQFAVAAKVRHFLGETPESNDPKRKTKQYY
jgi:hypothetical protein